MFEDSVSSIPSIWASMNSWFTPTVFFVLLNVVIGTIALTSSLTNQRQEQQEEKQAQDDPNPQNQPLLTRSLSVLERLRSINFYSSKSEESHQSSSISLHFNPTPDPDSDSGPFYASEPTNQREASKQRSCTFLEKPILKQKKKRIKRKRREVSTRSTAS
ncbi:hypothetical protein NMG60_11027791 [Bertholletia excelsa]